MLSMELLLHSLGKSLRFSQALQSLLSVGDIGATSLVNTKATKEKENSLKFSVGVLPKSTTNSSYANAKSTMIKKSS